MKRRNISEQLLIVFYSLTFFQKANEVDKVLVYMQNFEPPFCLLWLVFLQRYVAETYSKYTVMFCFVNIGVLYVDGYTLL